MSSQANYFRLGVFVLAAVALFVGGITVLGAGSWFKETFVIETYLQESVEGLNIGSPVKSRGVPIGQIGSISFASKKYPPRSIEDMSHAGQFIRIEIEVAVENLPPQPGAGVSVEQSVENGLRVRLTQSGLTSPPYLEIDYHDPDRHPPPQIYWTPERPYVPSIPSTLSQFVHTVQRILDKVENIDVDTIVADAQKLLQDADQAVLDLDIPGVREKAAALVDEVRESNNRIKAILDNPNIDRTVDDLSSTMASVKTIVGDGESDLQSFVADLPAISQRIRSSSDRIDELLHDPKVQSTLDGLASGATDVGPSLSDLRRIMRQLRGLVATQQNDIQSIIINLRRITENASALTEDARDNPSRVLFGDPPPNRQPGAQR